MAKIKSCGNYKCEHCSPSGKCCLWNVGVDKNGMCSQIKYSKPIPKDFDNDPDKEFYPYTNVC